MPPISYNKESFLGRKEDVMKIMKKILMVLMVLSMVVVFAGPAIAAAKWHICDLEQIGYDTQTGDIEVKLKSNKETKAKMFYLFAASFTDAEINRMLAMLLSCQTTGQRIKANIDYDNPGSAILGLRMYAQ